MSRKSALHRIVEGLVTRSPYSRRTRGGRIVVTCAYCGIESDEQRQPSVRDHLLDCSWAAGKEARGDGRE